MNQLLIKALFIIFYTLWLPLAVAKEYSASTLELDNVYAHVNILGYAENKIRVTIEPNSNTDAIHLSVQNDRLIIKGKEASITTPISINNNSTYTNIVIGNGASSSVNIGGKNQSITHKSKKLRLHIELPIENKLIVTGKVDTLKIDTIKGNLHFHINSAYDIELININNLSGHFKGSGDMIIKSMNGDASLNLSGSTTTTISNGNIGSLSIDASGVADANIQKNVSIVSKKITNNGSGDIIFEAP